MLGEVETGKRESVTDVKSNQLLKEKALVGTVLPSSLCDVIGFDFLSSREGQIGGGGMTQIQYSIQMLSIWQAGSKFCIETELTERD